MKYRMTALDHSPVGARLRVMDISHATDLWLGHLALEGKSDRTISTYRRLLDKLAGEHARHVDVDDITVTHLRGFLDRQSRRQDGGRKRPATVAQNVSIVAGFFDWLAREGIVSRNPTRRNGDRIMSRPRQVRPEDNDNVTTVSADGVRRLLAEANRGGWPERLAVNCLVYLGPRRRAVAQLRVGDYDPVGRMLTFREKGGVTIEKPVPHELARVIEAAIVAGVYESSDDYLVPGNAQQRRRGERDDRIIWRLVRQAAGRAGVTTHVHALRAAFAVHFLETHEGELVALQKLMGHKRIETTLVYLRRLDRRQQMETVRDLTWGAPQVPAPGASATPTHSGAFLEGNDRDTGAGTQFAEKPLEANGGTEKEGFEPSIHANPREQSAGVQPEPSVPAAALLETLRKRARDAQHAAERTEAGR